MFKITIEAKAPGELADKLQLMLDEFTGNSAAPAKPARRARATPQPEAEPMADEGDLNADDAQLERELREPVDEMPATGKTIVDAGTGQPADTAPIKMTMDDVRTAAAKLAAKDTPTLGKLLEKYGAAKLSEVPKEQLGDFATDVMKALV